LTWTSQAANAGTVLEQKAIVSIVAVAPLTVNVQTVRSSAVAKS
jgi:hypothetical protein